MLLEYISIYYKYLWSLLIAVALFKVIITNVFNEKLRGMNGIFYALFKWYNTQEQEMEDLPSRRTIMRFHNLVTLFLYFVGLLVLISYALKKTLPH